MKLRKASESVGWLNSVGPLAVSPQFAGTRGDRPMILNEDSVRVILEARIDSEGSQEAAAKWLGVSGAYLCDVMNKRRAPGPKLLKRLGIRRKVMYERY